MRKLGIHEILEMVESAPSEEDKIMILQNHDSIVLRQVLQYAFDVRAVWLLPEGPVPYRPSVFLDQEGALYTEARKLYLFLEGGHPGISQMKRETLFVQMLESLHPRDAYLLVHVKDKKLPYKTITPEIINKAFPGSIILHKRGPGRPRKEEDSNNKKDNENSAMSKSYKRRRNDDLDEMDVETKKKVSIDRRKKKRVDRALKTMDVESLYDYEDDYDPTHGQR